MKKKIVCMIPARLGSKRVKLKNLREINGLRLIDYPIAAAKESGIFDEIYVNSESEVFEEIANQHGVKFYKRDERFSADDATNDVFMHDFLSNVDCDIVIQLLPTSPFIDAQIIRDFVDEMLKEEADTMISVKEVKIECLYNSVPINYDALDKTKPSQTLTPVLAYACGIMGWKKEMYMNNMGILKAAYHGGTGRTKTYTLKGYATVDIDEEEDFQLAEVIARTLESTHHIFLPPLGQTKIFEHQITIKKTGDVEIKELAESDVPSILAKDGVAHNDLFDANKTIVNLQEIIDSMPKDSSWSKRLMDTENNSCTLICQNKDEGNRRHYHNDFDEFWLIIRGSYIYEIDGIDHHVKQGDFIMVPRNVVHYMRSTEDGSIRMAVSRADINHFYID